VHTGLMPASTLGREVRGNGGHRDPAMFARRLPANEQEAAEDELTAAVQNELSTRARSRQAARRKETFLSWLANGANVAECCEAAGVSINTYYQWRSRDRDFRREQDSIRAAQLGVLPEARWNGGFTTFRKEFFGYDTYFHQREIVHAIETARPMSVTMILCPPLHGKTTVMEDFISYKLAVNPNFRITVVSEGQSHAKKILGRVARRMTDPHIGGKYIRRFGPFHNPMSQRPWAAEFLTVEKASHDERDFSLETRGSTAAIAGTRTDLMIIDDIQSLRNYSQTALLVGKFRQDFLTRPGRDGIVVIVGTRVENDDFYETLLDAEVIDTLVCLPAVSDEAEVVECPKGPACDVADVPHHATLCPELWPPHELAKRRKQVGEAVWWRNYQQKPRLAGDATFAEEWLERSKSKLHRVGRAQPGHHVVIGVDPALSGGNALWAWGYDAETMQILDVVRDFNLTHTEQILNRLEEFALRYKPNDVIIEINAFQRALARDARLVEMSRKYGFRVREHTTGHNKADPILGVGSMAGSFERGEVIIPWADDFSRRRMEPVLAELRSWRPDLTAAKLRQDMVMAGWFGWRFIMERRAVLAAGAASWKRQGLPWRPTTWRRAS